MFTLTEVETNDLLNSTDPKAAAVALKLKAAEEKGEFVPKSRMTDLTKEVKDLTKKLADIDATTKAAEDAKLKAEGDTTKLLEREMAEKETLKAQLEAEKKDADAHRAFRASAVEQIKTKMGDNWRESYASLPLEDLAAMAETEVPLLKVVTTGGRPPVTPTLETKLEAAQKAGNQLEVISLKRQIAEAQGKK
jgi:hypothetical protein